MIIYLKEFGQYAQITGFKDVAFADAEGYLKASRSKTAAKIELQFYDADQIATERHLYFALLNALQAFQNKTNLSKTLAVETMLYASAQRQIQKAINRCGITPQTTRMAATLVGENLGEVKAALADVSRCVCAEPDDSVLELNAAKVKRIRGAFQISDEEIAAVAEKNDVDAAVVSLVVERVALLATQL